MKRQKPNYIGHMAYKPVIGVSKSSFIRLEYSVELLIEHSSTRLIPEVAINYRVAQNKLTPGSSFKFVVIQCTVV